MRPLPDVATQTASSIQTQLDWVGMSNVAMPMNCLDGQQGLISCQAKSQVGINLISPSTRGIHMSRLYLGLRDYFQQHAVTPDSLKHFLSSCIASHEGISTRASLRMHFDYLRPKRSLTSDLQGWQAYPIILMATLQDDSLDLTCEIGISYGSTCPCSASLARQLIESKMQEDFKSQKNIDKSRLSEWLLSENGTYATAHGQRSHAQLKMQLTPKLPHFPFSDIIQLAEHAIKTPSQTAVKRQDEQAFAHLSGQHLMFCEDAARILHAALNQESYILDFSICVQHLESLHAHDAMAMVCKGVPGGFSATL